MEEPKIQPIEIWRRFLDEARLAQAKGDKTPSISSVIEQMKSERINRESR